MRCGASRRSRQIGLCLKAIGRYEEALSAYRTALDRPSGSAQDLVSLRYVYARTLESMGRSKEAVECYRTISRDGRNYRDVAVRIDQLQPSTTVDAEAMHCTRKRGCSRWSGTVASSSAAPADRNSGSIAVLPSIHPHLLHKLTNTGDSRNLAVMVSSYSLSADVTHGCGRGLNEDDRSSIGMDRNNGVGVALVPHGLRRWPASSKTFCSKTSRSPSISGSS